MDPVLNPEVLMATLQILQPGPPITEQDVLRLEQELGASFPEDYRAFLLAHNGGYPEPGDFDIPGESVPESGSTVDWFLTLEAGAHNDLRHELDVYRGRVPPSLLPIAFDPGGNLICLGLSGEHRGVVYFWDHELEAEEDEEADFRNVYFVADSFSRFLDSLTAL
jgi:cell wall assembly regulator SMI1